MSLYSIWAGTKAEQLEDVIHNAFKQAHFASYYQFIWLQWLAMTRLFNLGIDVLFDFVGWLNFLFNHI